ncbi:hypothetical protein DSO57_1037440 [Entomophthora muscae]|uniref:Uncharacterized protein n=1 Tax=Entomophthora muscae TaxID=34485 RepID=A0ACC2RPV3_9FUNG|nr:hypothetical protein DSO57_1037440 [Entomophthora muscae]
MKDKICYFMPNLDSDQEGKPGNNSPETPLLSHIENLNQVMDSKWVLADVVRIDNSSSLETRAREQELNPKPGFL